MKKINFMLASLAASLVLAACSHAPKVATEPMPRSGFLPDYNSLVPMATSESETRVWRYRVTGVNPGSYTAVILDPVYLNQNVTKEVSAEVINGAKAALQASMVETVNARGNTRIVTQPGPGVARVSVGITGAESSADSLKPWNFTPIGLAVIAVGVNAKTPVLVVESMITDSQSKQILGESLVTVRGEPFRTASGSSDSFIAMVKKVVRAAVETSANPTPTGK
ncbi:MAG: DUF3313 family protein [Betaproteobacteria bacterium]